MTRPYGITGSLTPTFVPARAVALAVRRPFAFALVVRLPTALRAPSRASVTLSEATAPVKLPASHGPRRCERPREIVNKTRLALLDGLSPADWQRPARHAVFGPTTLQELLAITIIEHDRLHLRQLKE